MPNDTSPRFYDDFTPGMVFEFGHYSMTKERMIAFAREFDPQPFHTGDTGEISETKVIASGWHTGAATMRMLVENFFPEDSTLPSPGTEQIRFRKAVLPGDQLRARVRILEARATSKPDRGLIKFEVETINNHDETVMTMIVLGLFRRRSS